jgi:hypothetical protein
MKKIFLFAFIALSIGVQAQNSWIDIVNFKVGYGMEYWNASPVYEGFRYEQIDDIDANSGPLTETSSGKFVYPRYVMDFEAIGRNFYWHTNTNGAWDLLLRDLPKGYETVGNGDTKAIRMEWIPTKLGWGTWFNDKLGLYFGGNYAWDRFIFSDDDAPDEIILGGHKRGFHVQSMYSLRNTLIKSYIQYDWLNASKGASKGTGQSFDIEIYQTFGKADGIGLFAGLNWERLKHQGPVGTPTEDWGNDGVQNQGVSNRSYTFPEVTANAFSIKFGVSFFFGREVSE